MCHLLLVGLFLHYCSMLTILNQTEFITMIFDLKTGRKTPVALGSFLYFILLYFLTFHDTLCVVEMMKNPGVLFSIWSSFQALFSGNDLPKTQIKRYIFNLTNCLLAQDHENDFSFNSCQDAWHLPQRLRCYFYFFSIEIMLWHLPLWYFIGMR